MRSDNIEIKWGGECQERSSEKGVLICLLQRNTNLISSNPVFHLPYDTEERIKAVHNYLLTSPAGVSYCRDL